jgi:MYXO-CTERM domain-containing protein
MKKRHIAAAAVLLVALLLRPGPSRAAPEWIGQSVERKGGPLVRCSGPALSFSAAYQGEVDGSSPGVGDVYLIQLKFVNLGNCAENLGGTSYSLDPQFRMPKRHVPIHGYEYGGTTYRIQCALRDPTGVQSELAAEKCALKLGKDVTGRWFIDTMGGYLRSRYVVPRGHTLEVTVPVIALDPVAKDDGGFEVHVEVQMNALQSGFDFFDVKPPMVVASRPLMIVDHKVERLTANSAQLSADFFSRFLAGEAYIQLEPAPMFDSVRTEALGADTHNGRYLSYWADLTPDTEYTWHTGILVGEMRVLGEKQTFRTPPAISARQVRSAPGETSPPFPAEGVRLRHLQGACSVGEGTGGGAGWSLLLGVVLAGLLRRRHRPRLLLLAAAALALAGCSSKADPTPGPTPPATGGAGGSASAMGGAGGTGGGSAPTASGGTAGMTAGTGTGGAGGLRLGFLRAQPGLFTVPDGWQVNELSLKAWQQDLHHVVTMSPPGKPDIVLGVRQFLSTAPPSRVIYLASLQAEVVEVVEDKNGAGEGLYARWVARVTLDGQPKIMGMYSWATLADDDGERAVMLAALLTPTMDEFEQLGGIDSLRRIAYGQHTHSDGAAELQLSGEFSGAESTGGFYDPVTGQTSTSGFGLALSLAGDQISVVHSRQVAIGVGATSTSNAAPREASSAPGE